MFSSKSYINLQGLVGWALSYANNGERKHCDTLLITPMHISIGDTFLLTWINLNTNSDK